VGLVKLMGRESGFIAAYATMANSDVNFCLIPEASFTLEGFLKALKERLTGRGHAVMCVGERAARIWCRGRGARDASGNVRFSDIGLYLKDQINGYFKKEAWRSISSTLTPVTPSGAWRRESPRLAPFVCSWAGTVHAAMERFEPREWSSQTGKGRVHPRAYSHATSSRKK